MFIFSFKCKTQLYQYLLIAWHKVTNICSHTRWFWISNQINNALYFQMPHDSAGWIYLCYISKDHIFIRNWHSVIKSTVSVLEWRKWFFFLILNLYLHTRTHIIHSWNAMCGGICYISNSYVCESKDSIACKFRNQNVF